MCYYSIYKHTNASNKLAHLLLVTVVVFAVVWNANHRAREAMKAGNNKIEKRKEKEK